MHKLARILLSIYFCFVFPSCGTVSGIKYQQANYISTSDINRFSLLCKEKSTLEYVEVWKAAEKLFITGSEISNDVADYFQECNGPFTIGFRENDLVEYCLFAGSNGIIGKEIVLYIDSNNKISKLELLSWGR